MVNLKNCCIFGFDRSLRVLEVITALKVNGEEIVIHAMKVTQKVIDILREIQNGR
jgi:hypothetical protein